MSQAFFTLSIGIGAMLIFGAYLPHGRSLLGEAVTITALDTFVALMAGFIIIPSCFAYGIKPDAGPSLIFLTIPNLFVKMPGGQIWGMLFSSSSPLLHCQPSLLSSKTSLPLA